MGSRICSLTSKSICGPVGPSPVREVRPFRVETLLKHYTIFLVCLSVFQVQVRKDYRVDEAFYFRVII